MQLSLFYVGVIFYASKYLGELHIYVNMSTTQFSTAEWQHEHVSYQANMKTSVFALFSF